MERTWIIKGGLRPTANVFKLDGDKIAQIEFKTDLEYQNKVLNDVVLLRLDVVGSSDTHWEVKDHLASFLPYLKPVKTFREYLIKELRLARSTMPKVDQGSPFCPLFMGIGKYINFLEEFSEVRSLMSQLVNVTNPFQARHKNLDAGNEKEVIKKIESVLSMLGSEPKTKQRLVIKY